MSEALAQLLAKLKEKKSKEDEIRDGILAMWRHIRLNFPKPPAGLEMTYEVKIPTAEPHLFHAHAIRVKLSSLGIELSVARSKASLDVSWYSPEKDPRSAAIAIYYLPLLTGSLKALTAKVSTECRELTRLSKKYAGFLVAEKLVRL